MLAASPYLILCPTNYPISDPAIEPYKYLSQDSFLHLFKNQKLTPQNILSRGLNIGELHTALKSMGVDVLLNYSRAISAKTLEQDLIKIQNDPSTFMIINFDRSSLGQTGHGHFSPIAGHHQIQQKAWFLTPLATSSLCFGFR